MKTYTILIFSVIMPLAAGCALQKDVYRMEDRVAVLERRNIDLEKQNKTLREQVQKTSQENREKVEAQLQDRASEEQRLRAQYAGLNATFDKFTDDINQLNGRIDESEYFLKQDLQSMQESQKANAEQLTLMRQELDDAMKRVAQLEAYLNLEKKNAGTATPAAEPQKADEKSENDIYFSAKQAFDASDFEAARNGFEALITKYPKSANADNAQFWLGEIYYKEKWYEKAILEYQKVIENYPKGNKVPAALLKQGMAFLEIGDSANSRLILKELARKYPNTNEAKIANQKLKEIK